MAEIESAVHITGTDLPQWATETTAATMAEYIAELVDISTKTQQSVVKQLQANGKITEDLATEIGEGKSSLGEDLDKAADSALDTAAGFDKVGKHLPGFADTLKKLPKTVKLGIAGFGMLAAGMAHAVAIVRETAGVLKNMNDAGIRVEGGIRELQHSLSQTGMTLDELQNITSKYAQVVGTNGWKAITNLTEGVNALDGGFRKYGITTAEATEFTAEYLEQQRMAGVFGAASQRNQSAALQQNIERLTAYSKTLNVSRKAMMETTTTMLSREDVRARFALMEPEERAKAQEAFAATIQGFASLGPAGEKFGSLLTDMIANPTEEAAESFKQIAQAAPELAQDLVSMSKRVKAGEKVTQEEIMMTLEKAGNNKVVLEQLKRAGGEIGAMADSILVASLARENAAKNEIKLRAQFEKETQEVQAKGFEEWKRTSSDAVVGVTGVDDAMAKLHATIQEQVTVAFLDLVGDAGGAGVRGLIDGIDKLTNIIGMFDDTGWVTNFREFFGEGLGGAIRALGALSAIVLVGPTALVHGIPVVFKWMKSLGTLIGTKLIPAMGGWKAAIGKAGAAAAAFSAGYAVGGWIYKKTATGIQDTLARWAGNEPTAKEIAGSGAGGNIDFKTGKVRTPDEQRMHEEMRAKRRAAPAPTTSTEGAPTQTTPSAPTMSEADIAKLDKADQQLAWLKKISRGIEANAGMMA